MTREVVPGAFTILAGGLSPREEPYTAGFAARCSSGCSFETTGKLVCASHAIGGLATGNQMNKYLFALSFTTLIACGSTSTAPAGGLGSGGTGGSTEGGGSSGNPVRCVTGQQVACACVGGLQGAQACKADGSGYLACACASDGGESGGGASGSTGDPSRGGSDDPGGADTAGAAGANGGGGGASGASEAGAAGEAGTSGAGDIGTPLACSANSAAVSTARGVAILHVLFSSAATFCLPQANYATAGISVCTSAACANTPNTCSAAFTSTTLSFEPASSTFNGTGDLIITGAATAAAPLSNCPNLQITAPGATVTGTLHAALVPIMIPTGVQYTASNLVVKFNTIAVAGCDPTVISVLNAALANDVVKQQIEQTVASDLGGQSYTVPCTAGGA